MEAARPKPSVSLLSLLLVLLSLFSLSSATLCNPSEQKVLLHIKNKLNPTDTAFSNWDPKTAPDCCSWSNVNCSVDGRVISLNLNLDTFERPAVEIPPAIGDLPFLESLDIDGKLTGPIPASIAGLSHLQHLSLLTGLTGPIPSSLARLKRLTSLHLLLNHLSGSIPSTLGQLTALTTLELGSNHLSGSIPTSLGQLVGLDWLSLAGNRLSGPIPASLSRLNKLSRLDLRYNRLTGSIPASFGSFNNPKMGLLLADNRLSGPIPRSVGQANVSWIELTKNRFTGDASFLFGRDKTALETIYLSNNRFKFDFSNVELPLGLRNLDISHNEIYGSLPKRLGQLRWFFINVSNNRLCGKIPKGRRLKRVAADAFAHNKCLCGLPLPPCK